VEVHLKKLQHELETFTYSPAPQTIFIIRDPKTRKISASHFRDRVVHHAICNIIEPILEKSFIHDSFASRKGKGVHSAILRFEKFLRKMAGNGKRGTGNGYALKADIKHYFDAVDHRILLGILRRRIRDRNVLWLISVILKNHKTKVPGKGMPLGNLTSQFFANVYLNEFDHFVKHGLKAKYYIRYVDDFVILHRDREMLEQWQKQISSFLREWLELELHPEKSRVIPVGSGVGLLGFRVFCHYRLLKKSNARRIWKRIEKFRQEYAHGWTTKEEISQSMEGWFAYAKFASTYNLRKKVSAKLNELFGDVAPKP